MDGVLIDSERLILECTLEAAPTDADREKLRQAMFESLGVTNAEVHRIIRAHMGPDFSFDVCERRATEIYFARLEAEGVPVKPGAPELLAHLSENGYTVGLASSSPRALVEKELAMAGLLRYFQALATGDMVKHSKPAPDIYLLACEKLGARPADAYAVEDAPKGIQSALDAGLRPLMVPDLAPATPELAGLCHAVFPTLLDLLNWVKACESNESA